MRSHIETATLLHSYMPDPDWDDRAEQLRQDSWYLIWPTADYMQCGISDEVGESNHMLFISAEVLALMEPDILAQLRTYEPLAVGGTNAVLAFPPHIKSYARVYRSIATEHISDSTQSACLCPSVAWFLLTSACLSKGCPPFINFIQNGTVRTKTSYCTIQVHRVYTT